MNLDSYHIRREIDYFFAFLPYDYIKNEMIPATNLYGKNFFASFKQMTIDDFIHVMGMLYSMEVYQLPVRRMYWNTEPIGIFPAMDFGRVMSRSRFEEILRCLQFSSHKDKDEQILCFLEAVNEIFKEAFSPGDTLCLDESMVKSYHKGLKGKMKIIRKPRPIGNEFKNMSDSRTNIVNHLELYEGKEYMASKKYVGEYGATTATVLRLTQAYHGSGRIIVGDSWFGSVKTAVALSKVGLYCNMMVKTAHKNFPRDLLNETQLARGEWNAYHTVIDDVPVQVYTALDGNLY